MCKFIQVARRYMLKTDIFIMEHKEKVKLKKKNIDKIWNLNYFYYISSI